MAERAERLAEGPKTEAQERRAEKIARRRAPFRPEPEADRSHQLKVPWPHSLGEYPADWLKGWQTVAEDMGISLRFSAFRHAAWRDNLEVAAACNELTFTAKDKDRPGARASAVHLLADIVRDAQRRRVPADVDWHTIVSQWDGEDFS